jgi:hypothetical protein
MFILKRKIDYSQFQNLIMKNEILFHYLFLEYIVLVHRTKNRLIEYKNFL